MRLYTSLFLLGSSFWTPAGAVNELEDTRCITNATARLENGRRGHLVVEMDPLEKCYVLFRDPDNNYQCCYGPNEVCDENGRECLQPNYEYFIHTDPMVTETCSFEIESVNKTQAGFYKFLNMDGDEVQECFVVVDEPSSTISVPLPAFIGLMVIIASLVISNVTWAGFFFSAKLKLTELKLKLTETKFPLTEINCQAQTDRH